MQHINYVSRRLANASFAFLAMLIAAFSPFSMESAFAQATSAPVGTIEGEFKVSGDGAAMYAIPIAVPPGTNGVQPNLSLRYNSHQRNRQLGMGWSLTEISSITRCAQTQVQDGDGFVGSVGFDANNRFCVDGQRLMVTSGDYGSDSSTYRTEIETWAEFTAHGSCGVGPCYFTASTKEGSQLVFGEGGGSQVLVPESDTARVWSLHKITDRHGNTVKAFYLEDSDTYEPYLDRIEYTSNENTGNSAQRMVKFEYEEREDVTTAFVNGHLTKNTLRLNRISTYVDMTGSGITDEGNSVISEGNLVNSYNIDYEYSPATKRSRIHSVEICDAEDICLPATTFEWQQGELSDLLGGSGDNLSVNTNICANGSSGCNDTDNHSTIAYPDVNGDGYFDLTVRADSGIKIWWGSASGFSNNNVTSSAICKNSECNDDDNYTTIHYPDLNADGRADLVFRSDGGGIQVYHGSDQGFVFQQNTGICKNSGGDCEGNQNYTMLRYPDVNGDGFLDIALRRDNGIKVWWGSATGFSASSFVSSSICDNGECNDADNHTTIKYLDLNADGKADLLFRSDSGGIQVYHGSDQGFVFQQNTGICKNSGGDCEGNQNYTMLQYPDVNGDGFLDIALRRDNGIKVWWGSATGFSASSFVSSSICGNGECNDEDNHSTIRYPDFNSDGKADLAFRSDSGGIQVYLGSDDGFVFQQSTGLCKNNYSNCNDEDNYQTLQYTDINADGFTDIAVRKDNGVTIWWGGIDGFSESNAAASSICNNSECNDEDNYSAVQFLDATGDRMTDLVYRSDAGGVQIREIFSSHPDRIVKIVDGVGKEITVEYKPLTDTSVYTKGSSATGKEIDIQFSQYVVSRHTLGIEGGASYAFSHHFSGAKWQSQGRGFLGFSQTEITNEQTGDKTITTLYQDFPYTGSTASEEVQNEQGRTLVKNTLLFDSNSSDNGIYTIFKTQEVTHNYDATGQQTYSRSREYAYDESHSHITQIIDHGDDRVSDDNVYACYQYYASEDHWKQFFPIAVKLSASACQGSGFSDSDWAEAVDLSFKKYEYDGVMNLVKQRAYDNGKDAWVESANFYDAYGNVIHLTDPESNEVTISYDETYHSFPAVSTALFKSGDGGLSAITTYEPKFGLKVETQDVNGTVISKTDPLTDIDGFGRVVASQYANPDGSGLATVSKANFVADDEGGVIVETLQRKDWEEGDSDNWLWTKVYVDALGREFKSERKADDGKILTSHILFDNNGRIWKEATLHFQGDSDVHYTIHEYDALGNKIKVIGPDGAYQRYDYGEAIDERNIELFYPNPANPLTEISSVAQTNTRGKIVRTVAVDGSEKNYTYDLLGRRVAAEDALGQLSTSTYNSLGQVVSQSKPELGTSYYEYYDTGLIKTYTDAKNQKIVYAYDELGRILSKYDSEGDELARYEYDQGANGKGKLSKTYVNGVLTYEYVYDYLGAIKSTIVHLDTDSDGQTETFTTSFTYDAAGHPDTVIYPDGTEVKYEYYQASGHLQHVLKKSMGDAAYQTLVTYSDYDHFGNPLISVFGNGVTSDFEYDVVGRLHSDHTYNGAFDFTDKTYHWTIANKVTSTSHEDDADMDETNAYYNTGALSFANGPYGAVNYDYDLAGNITTKGDISYQYDTHKKHQMISACLGESPCNEIQRFVYDDNGNMTEKAVVSDASVQTLWQYTYDKEDRLTSVRQQRFASSAEQLIEAEDYTSQFGVQSETTTDTGGGQNIGYIQEGDYLTYVVEVPADGAYSVELRLASKASDAVINISNGLDDVSVAMPTTGGWQNWTTIDVDVNFNEGLNTLRLDFEGSGFLGNINWLKISPKEQFIEAESYSDQLGVKLENTTDTGGGQNVGFIQQGDYVSYDITAPVDGLYSMDLRLASTASDAIIRVSNGAGGVYSVDMPTTGGWQNWTTVNLDIALRRGENQLTLEFEGNGYLGNINWFTLAFQSGTDSELVNSFTYDDVGRRLSKTDADGTISYYISPLMDITVRSDNTTPVETNYFYGSGGSVVAAQSVELTDEIAGFIASHSDTAIVNMIGTETLLGKASYAFAKGSTFLSRSQVLLIAMLVLTLVTAFFVVQYALVLLLRQLATLYPQLREQMSFELPIFALSLKQGISNLERPALKINARSREKRWARYALSAGLVAFLAKSSIIGSALAASIGSVGGGYPEANQIRYFHQNAIESSVIITDENGLETNKVVYEPYGSLDEESSIGEDNFRPKFSGKEFDSSTELYYFGSRYYDADLGRFITPDPAGQFDSPYLYAMNDPLSHIDPDGEFAFTIGTIVILTLTATGAYSGGAAANGSWDASSWDMADWRTWAGIAGGGALGAAGGSSIAGGSIFSASLIMGSQSALFTGLAGGSTEEIGTSFATGFVLGFAGSAALGGGSRVAGYYFGPTAGPAIARSSLLIGLTGYDAYTFANDPSIENGVALGTDLVLIGAASRSSSLKRVAKQGQKHTGCSCCFSFPAGTEIAVENGYKNIEDIQIGDEVWSYDATASINELNLVSDLFSRVAEKVILVSIGNSEGVDEIISVTPEHPFYILGGDWIKAEDLTIGHQLLQLDGSSVTVLDIGHRDGDVKVFNFAVDVLNNYYASDAEVLVHNTKSCGRYSQRVATKTQHQRVQSNIVPTHSKRVSKPPARYGNGDGLLKPGPYAHYSTPGAYNRNFTAQQRQWLNGKPCHRCGNTPATVLDHQPPMSIGGPNAKYKLYPHCANCSSKQGGLLAQMKAAGTI